MSPEDRFVRELEHLRRDGDAAAQCLYSWLAFHHYAGANKKTRLALNRTPLFWNTGLGALQATLFIALGRIFDTDPRNHTIDRLLREAAENRQIFSKPSLAARKKAQSPGATWIRDYVRDAYVPTDQDFKRLSGYVKRKRTIYRKTYGHIRHKVFAHNALGSAEKKNELFSKTEIGELQRLVLSIRAFHEALWQLYFNGRRPAIKVGAYSVRSMKKDMASVPINAPVEQRIFAETCEALTLVTTGTQRK